MCFEKQGIEAHRLVVFRDCVLGLSLVEQDRRQIVVRHPAVGIAGDGIGPGRSFRRIFT